MEGSAYEGFYAKDNFLFENELENKNDNKNKTAIFGCAEKETGFL